VAFAAGCPSSVFNIAATSGFYAQMTGVLAGFAFTAIVVLLTPTQATERAATSRAKDNGVLSTLFAAFIALIIATLIYSVLAGETSEVARGRAATVELVDGVPFGLAVIMLFQGITLLMRDGNVDLLAIRTARVVTVAVAPTLTLYYIGEGVSDTESARVVAGDANSCPSTTFPVLGPVLSVALFVVLATALIPTMQPAVLRAWAGRLQGAVPITVLVVSVAAAIAGGNLSTAAPGFLMPRPAVNVFLAGTFILLVLIGLVLALGQPDHQARLDPSETTVEKPTQTASGPAPNADELALDRPAESGLGAAT
jgi:hypothetical protein